MLNKKLDLVNTSSEYDLDKINVPNVTYIKTENTVKYAQISEKVTVTLSISAAGIGTFCAPFDVQLPENVKAQYPINVQDGGHIDMVEYNLKNRILPAYTPAIVESEEVVSKTYEGYKTLSRVLCNNGFLYGALETIKPRELFGTNKTVWILQNINGTVGMYAVDDDDVSVPAYKTFMITQNNLEN